MRGKRRIIGWILTAFLVIAGCSGCGKTQTEQFFDRNGVAMDTTVSLRAAGGDAQGALQESMDFINRLDRLAGTNHADSDISKINAAAGKSYVAVDPDVYEMISFAKTYSEKSRGAWDISVGIFTKLWDIGNPDEHIPAPAEIQKHLSYVNYKDILLRPSDHAVMLAKPGMYIDLGGVAKGFAVDEILKIYKKHKVTNGLINLGASSMYAMNTNAKGTAWNIGIKHPRVQEDGTYLGIVKIQDQFLSTSGDYERYFIKNGVRYHHIFDPKTGYPARHGVMSDSLVIQGDVPHGGMLSDILTTVVFVLGPEKGLAFIENTPGVEGEITGTDGTVYMTKGFKKNFSDLHPDFHLAQ